MVGVDIGSVRPPSKFAWASVDASEAGLLSCGDDPEGAVQALVGPLARGGQAALVVEAPMAVPVPREGSEGWRHLGQARTGEGNRPWSAGAGVLATGVAQTSWMLSRLRALVPRVTATTQPHRFLTGQADLLLAEAFVSGAGKPVPVVGDQHRADAEAAARAALQYLTGGAPGGVPTVSCAPQRPLNLVALLAAWAGIELPSAEWREDVLVIRTRPVT